MMLARGVLATSGLKKDVVVVDVKGIEVGPDIPILDCHNMRNGCLGYLERAWVDEDVLWGELIFTGSAGARAYKRIERGELAGVSCGFLIDSVAFCDGDGDEVDLDEALERGPDDPDLTVIATRVTLREVSITATPADPNAFVRAIGFEAECWRMIRQGEEALHRILHSDGDGVDGGMYGEHEGFRRIVMPPLIQYAPPEPILR
jgi:hypothetical protein